MWGFFIVKKIELFVLFKIVYIMWAIEWFSPYKYLINTKKQSKKAEKIDIREKVLCKVVLMWFGCIEKDRTICDL
jgi:hypothetical protein